MRADSPQSANVRYRPPADVEARLLAEMDRQAAIALYDQFWSQARHAEEQRQQFFQFYLVIAGVAVGIIGQDLESAFRTGLGVLAFSFLTVVSVFGLLLTYVWNTAYTAFSRQAERVQLCHLDTAGGFVNFFGSLRWPQDQVRIRVTAIRLYPLAYAIGGAVFASGASAAVSAPLWLTVVCGLATLIALVAIAELYLDRHRNHYLIQFEQDMQLVMHRPDRPAIELRTPPMDSVPAVG